MTRLRVRALAAVLLLLFVSAATYAAEKVSPITSEPSNQARPGKVVWVDLMTHDVRRATDFYRQVFGWAIRLRDDGSYAEAHLKGKPVASFVRYDADAPDGEAQWLVSISVSNLEQSVAAVRNQGGEVLEGPEKLPDRGRFALARDSRGALFVLLKATGGDPDDEPAAGNEWLWAELWTDDVEASTGFYEAVLGYKSVAVKEKDGSDLRVMGRDGVARATVVELPWTDVKPAWLTYLQVDDLAASLASVLKNGGSVLLPPSAVDDGNVAIVSDPTGGVFALQSNEEMP